jgi:glycosyltransferase involved in cell wall biosynthesis
VSSPVISVLLAVHNGGPLLDESIRSILAQTFTDFELLIIEDGSTDDSFERASAYRDPRVRVIRNETNLGLPRTLNRGLAEARGEFVARQDADDVSAPNRFALQMAFLREHPEVVLLGSSSVRIDPDGRSIGTNDLPTTHDAIRWASLTDNPFLHTSVMFRCSVALELGGYDETVRCEDYALWNRMAERYPVANLPERLVFMREHAASVTRTQPTQVDESSRTILIRSLPSLFPGRSFSKAEVETLSLFRRRFESPKLRELESLLSELCEDFQGRYPATRHSRDFRATLCRQKLRLVFKFLGSAPQMALPRVFHAMILNPVEAMKQAMLVMARVPGIGRVIPIPRL